MAITPNPEHMTRLALVRFLLQQADHQVEKPSPIDALALLPMHDAIEMFLDLAADAANAPVTKREFRDYWTALAQCDPPIKLPLQRSMDKLNRARVALKHHGQRASLSQIKEHLVNCKTFVDEACVECFGITIYDASMLSLIRTIAVADILTEAQTAMRSSDLTVALEKAAFAFSEASESQFHRLPRLSSALSLRLGGLGFKINHAAEDAVRELLKPVHEAMSYFIKDYESTVALLSLGIDLRDYKTFRDRTPIVFGYANGHRTAQWMKEPPSEPESAQWCIDFVVDFTLRVEAKAL